MEILKDVTGVTDEEIDKMTDAWVVAARPHLREVGRSFLGMAEAASKETARSIAEGVWLAAEKMNDATARFALEEVACVIEKSYGLEKGKPHG